MEILSGGSSLPPLKKYGILTIIAVMARASLWESTGDKVHIEWLKLWIEVHI